jgi:hypothetical protein
MGFKIDCFQVPCSSSLSTLSSGHGQSQTPCQWYFSLVPKELKKKSIFQPHPRPFQSLEVGARHQKFKKYSKEFSYITRDETIPLCDLALPVLLHPCCQQHLAHDVPITSCNP